MRGISGREWVILSQLITPQKDMQEKYGYLIAQILANRNLDDRVFDNRLKNSCPITSYQTWNRLWKR